MTSISQTRYRQDLMDVAVENFSVFLLTDDGVVSCPKFGRCMQIELARFRCAGNFFIASLAFSDIMMGLAYALYNVSHMELPDIQQVLG